MAAVDGWLVRISEIMGGSAPNTFEQTFTAVWTAIVGNTGPLARQFIFTPLMSTVTFLGASFVVVSMGLTTLSILAMALIFSCLCILWLCFFVDDVASGRKFSATKDKEATLAEKEIKDTPDKPNKPQMIGGMVGIVSCFANLVILGWFCSHGHGWFQVLVSSTISFAVIALVIIPLLNLIVFAARRVRNGWSEHKRAGRVD
jgi:hypothetical protein